MRCQDTYLYVRSWIYEQSLICYFLNIVLACCLLVIGRTEGGILKKIGVQHDGKIFFARFSDFFKKLFRALNPCFRLFSPVLRTPTRACVFIIFEKNG